MFITMFFFFNDTATTEIYTLSYTTLFRSDPLPYIYDKSSQDIKGSNVMKLEYHQDPISDQDGIRVRSEEHTSELQSQSNLVCRLLLEKKNTVLLPCAMPAAVP